MEDLTGKYCFRGINDDSYFGSFDMLKELLDDVGNEIGLVVIGKYTHLIERPDGSDLVNYITDRLSECMEDDWFDYCTGKILDLAVLLDNALDKFFDEHPINYWMVSTELSEGELKEIEAFTKLQGEK